MFLDPHISSLGAFSAAGYSCKWCSHTKSVGVGWQRKNHVAIVEAQQRSRRSDDQGLRNLALCWSVAINCLLARSLSQNTQHIYIYIYYFVDMFFWFLFTVFNFLIYVSMTCVYYFSQVRIPTQSENERNFHVFYQMCKGGNEEEKERWELEGKSQEVSFVFCPVEKHLFVSSFEFYLLQFFQVEIYFSEGTGQTLLTDYILWLFITIEHFYRVFFFFSNVYFA